MARGLLCRRRSLKAAPLLPTRPALQQSTPNCGGRCSTLPREHSGGLRIVGDQPRLVSPEGPALPVLRWELSNLAEADLTSTTRSRKGCGIDGKQFGLRMLVHLSYLRSATMGNARPQLLLRRRKPVAAAGLLQGCRSAGGLPDRIGRRITELVSVGYTRLLLHGPWGEQKLLQSLRQHKL